MKLYFVARAEYVSKYYYKPNAINILFGRIRNKLRG